MTITATRILDSPIIYPHMDARMGDNINGPALVRAPDWLPNPLGKYYLYFSDHKGSYIRLAYADFITGPWAIYTPGALDLKDSLFETTDPPLPPQSERPPWAKKMKGGFLYAHIASPDVHVDHSNRRLLMYYHGLLRNGDQQTRLAVSKDGVTFQARQALLGPPYFRAFTYADFVYVITWGGEIWRASGWQRPFEQGPCLIHFNVKEGIGEGFRHGEVHRVGNKLYVFYTRMGDAPERILYVEVALNPDWKSWRASDPVELMRPQLDWEGTDLPVTTSTMGAETGRVHALRDPCVFEDEDRATYLLYCGAGENGIGVAKLSGF